MAQILIVEDEQRIASFVAKGLRAEGHQPTVVGRRPGGPRRGAVGRLRPDGARHRPARHGRLRGARPAALPGQPDAGDRADRARLGHRHGRGARRRRRRLHGQAVPLRRAAGPGAAAAAHGRRRRRRGRTRRCSQVARRASSTGAPAACRSAASELDLSAREFALAEIFMLNPGQVLSREQLLDHVWGYDFDPVQRRRRLRRLPAQEVRQRRHRDRARHGLPLPAG